MRALLPVLLLLASPVQAQTALEAKTTFVGNCMKDGESAAMCDCQFDTWMAFVPADQKQEAYSIAHLFSLDTQPTEAERARAMPYVPALNQAEMQCANTVGEQASGADSNAMLEQLGAMMGAQMSAEERAQMQALMSGDMSALFPQGMPQPAAPTPTEPEPEAEAAPSFEVDYRALFDEEWDRIMASEPRSLAVADYEQLFTLNCLANSGGENAERCGCTWQALVETDGGAENVALAYMASIPPSDGIYQLFPGEMVRDAFARFDDYYQARDRCF